MGLFNEILVPCPNCKEPVVFQTKSGSCELLTYPISRVPAEELYGILGDTEFCSNCHRVVYMSDCKDPDYVDASYLVKDRKM